MNQKQSLHSISIFYYTTIMDIMERTMGSFISEVCSDVMEIAQESAKLLLFDLSMEFLSHEKCEYGGDSRDKSVTKLASSSYILEAQTCKV